MTTLNLNENEVNELRFILANLESPSRKQALILASAWREKLTLVIRKMHPVAVQTINVN